MANNDILALWKKISSVIADEISANENLAQKLSVILDLSPNEIKAGPKRKSGRAPAKVDPFALLEQGEDRLNEALKGLTEEELKDVISAHGLDPAKQAMRWKKRDRLEKQIVDQTKQKASRGAVFWNSMEPTVGETETLK